MSNVHALSFKVPLATRGIRVGCQQAFEADPVGEYFYDEPDRMELRKWLDANASGWKLGYRATGYENRKPPVGKDEEVSFVNYSLWIEFQNAQHQRAFSEFYAAIQERNAKRAERTRETLAAGRDPCYHCGLAMVREPRTYTSRWADVEVTIERQMGNWCDVCGHHTMNGSDLRVQNAVTKAFWAHTDIPSPRTDGKRSSAEYRRRQSLPARAKVTLTQGMSTAEVDRLMRDALQAIPAAQS